MTSERDEDRILTRRDRKRLAIATGIGIILLVIYARLPKQVDGVTTHVIVGFFVGVALFTVVLGYIVIRGSNRENTEDRWLRLISTLIALVATIFFFALSYLRVATTMPTEFSGLTTFIDAIYFTIATTLTVGFGDVYASGQWARVMVIIQMIFTVVVLAAAGRSMVGVFQAKSKEKHIHNLEKELARVLEANAGSARSVKHESDDAN